MKLASFFCALVIAGCTTTPDLPLVQPTASGNPGGRIVELTPEGTISPPCLVITVGQTVEFRNLADRPGDITSLGSPTELYSPNLISPGPTTWRHTFNTLGVFEYYDSTSGDPGRKVVDPYYGTVTFVGLSEDIQTGAICVKSKGGSECDNVCCVKAVGDCPSTQCCDLTNRRCVLASPETPALCIGKKPAFREFDCFSDNDCEGLVCEPEHRVCE